MSAIARITGGTFPLVQRLFGQIERILRNNHLQAITQEVAGALPRTSSGTSAK